jgi:hypothetical protein
MPTIQNVPGPYQFYFYSSDCKEAKHVHVWRDRQKCKFWIEPIELFHNDGFSAHELSRIRAIIERELPRILEAWHEHCD